MSTNISLKNSTDTTLTIKHSDGSKAKIVDSKDIAVAVSTIADFPANPNDGDVVIVRDTGVTYIYDGTNWLSQNNLAPNPTVIVETNLGLGKNALSLISGSVGLNTAVGYNCAGKVTIGGNNTSYGANAHFQNMAGNNSVAIGENAHRNMGVDGSAPAYNTAVGMGAMYVKSTGFCNTAIGADAFASFKDDADRAVGDATGLYHDYQGNVNTGGSYNTAIGQNAITYSSGDYNSAVGCSAGVYATIGDGNTIIGGLAGASSGPSVSGNYLETGSNNTFLGYKASPSYALKNSDYMTAIGADSLVESVATVVLGRTEDVTVIGKTFRANNTSTTGANLQLGGGILFGNNNESGTCVLDWYEESTFTVTQTGISGNVTMVGKATRIGRQCFFNVSILPSPSTTHSGTDAVLDGLPWDAFAPYGVAVWYNTSTGGIGQGSIQHYSGSTKIALGTYSSTGGQILVSGSFMAES